MAIQLAQIVAGAMGGFGLAQSFPPITRALAQTSNRIIPNELISIGEALRLWVRKEISDKELEGELVRVGLNDTRIGWLKKLTQELVSIMDDIALWRRGKLSSEELTNMGEELGYTKERLQRLIEVSEVIPSSSDIISFAVREVYSPEIARTFGQFEGLEDVYDLARSDITSTGMSKETFGKYWAAHWRLPGIQQGYEMLHRNVISKENLDKLMIALDIMPFWRDPLLAISYHPYTRVDVRRMYRTGVLDEAGVLRAYEDLGYDEEKAKKMTEFTIKYESSPTDEDMSEDEREAYKTKELTKADICRGYRLKLITREDAKDALLSMTYDEDSVEFYLTREDYLEEEDRCDKYLKWFHDAYTKEIWDKHTLLVHLGELNLPASYTDYLLDIWTLEKEVKVNQPTKSEILGFLRKKIIERETAVAELRKLRYPDKYIDWYLEAM